MGNLIVLREAAKKKQRKEFMSYMRSKAAYDKLAANEKPKYFIQWKNTAADSFFKNIVKSSKGALTGIYKNKTNLDLQYYSYQILMVSKRYTPTFSH